MTTNKFSPEVRDRAVRMVLDYAGEHTSERSFADRLSSLSRCQQNLVQLNFVL